MIATTAPGIKHVLAPNCAFVFWQVSANFAAISVFGFCPSWDAVTLLWSAERNVVFRGCRVQMQSALFFLHLLSVPLSIDTLFSTRLVVSVVFFAFLAPETCLMSNCLCLSVTFHGCPIVHNNHCQKHIFRVKHVLRLACDLDVKRCEHRCFNTTVHI